MEAIELKKYSFLHHCGGRLTDDLLIEILLRLPFKSLARFKCVCKPWKTLISNSDFQKQLPTTMIGLFYQRWRINIPGYVSVSSPNCRRSTTESAGLDLDLSFCPNYPNIRLMGCTNGLLLLLHGSARPPSPYFYHGNLIPPHPDVFYVCNPVSRRWVALPECPRTRRWHDSVLISDPRRSPHFKVVRIDSLKSCSLELTTFCSETGSWAKSTITTTLRSGRLACRGIVSSDGIIYRMIYRQVILRINVEDETCIAIKFPGKVPPFPRFGLFGGNLYVAHIVEGSQLQVWELKNLDGSEWVPKYSKCVEPALLMQNIQWRGSRALNLLAFHLDIDDIFYIGVSNKIISYNVNSDTVEEVFSFSDQQYSRACINGTLRAHPFRPSFLDLLPHA